MIRGSFWRNMFFISCLGFNLLRHLYVTRHILLYFTNLTTSLPFRATWINFYKILSWFNLLNMIKKTFLEILFWCHVKFLNYDIIHWRHLYHNSLCLVYLFHFFSETADRIGVEFYVDLIRPQCEKARFRDPGSRGTFFAIAKWGNKLLGKTFVIQFQKVFLHWIKSLTLLYN